MNVFPAKHDPVLIRNDKTNVKKRDVNFVWQYRGYNLVTWHEYRESKWYMDIRIERHPNGGFIHHVPGVESLWLTTRSSEAALKHMVERVDEALIIAKAQKRYQ